MLKPRAQPNDELTLKDLKRRAIKQEGVKLVARTSFLGGLMLKFSLKTVKAKFEFEKVKPDREFTHLPWESLNAEQQQVWLTKASQILADRPRGKPTELWYNKDGTSKFYRAPETIEELAKFRHETNGYNYEWREKPPPENLQRAHGTHTTTDIWYSK